MAWVACAFALAAAEEALLQLVAVWPGPPQNKQRLLSRRHCSCCVNFPSSPSLSARGLVEAEDDNDLLGLLLLLFLLPLLLLLLLLLL